MRNRNAILILLCAPQRKGGAWRMNISTNFRDFCLAVLASVVANLVTSWLMNL